MLIIIVIPIIIVIAIVPFMMFMMFVVFMFFMMLIMVFIVMITIRAIMFMPNSYYDNESCHKKACNMLIPVLYLSLSIRDPNHVDDNVYNNHKHPAYAYRKFWLFQEPNRHSPNFFRTACNNHPMNYWTYYILHINAFDNLIAPLRHIYLPCL